MADTCLRGATRSAWMSTGSAGTRPDLRQVVVVSAVPPGNDGRSPAPTWPWPFSGSRGQPPRQVRVQIRTPSPASGGRATAAVASGVGPASTGVIVTPGI